MIAYVVINESTVMFPVTFPVAHIMTIHVFVFCFFCLWFICAVVNDLDYLETLGNEHSLCPI